MTNCGISTEDPSYRKYVRVLDTHSADVDVGNGDPIVFLHGVPTPPGLSRRSSQDRSDVKSLQERKMPEDFLKARRDSQS